MKTRQSHVSYYSHFVSELGASFNTKGEQKSVDSMDTEIENVRAAWRWAVEYKCWDEIGTMLHTMMLYYQARSMLREGGATFDALAQVLTEHQMQDSLLYWRTRVRQAMLQGRLGDYTQSLEQSQAALHYFEAQNNDYEQCIALNNISYACMMHGRYEESAEFATQALPKARAVREIEITQYFVALGNLGYVRYLMGDYEEARAIYEDFIKDSKQAKYSPIGLAFGYNNLGEIRRELGDLKVARQLFEDAYDIFKQYNTRRGMAFSLNNLGGITFMLGDREKAWKMYQKAYRLNKEIGDRYGIGHSVSALGNNAFFASDYDSAKDYYTEALTVRRELGNQRDVADSLDDLAYLSLAQLDFDNARRYLDECLTIREAIGDRAGKARALIGLALVDKLTDHDKAGREKLAQAQSIAMEIENSFILAQVNAGLGEYAVYDDDFENAQQYFHKSLRLAKQLQVKGVLLYAVAGVADLKAHLGQHEDAVALASMVAAQSAMGYNMGQRMAQQVLDASREQVPNLVFEKGQQHGESLDLYTVVDRLLSE
jgi:tetratricopeptide (TPR) repeat protein